MLKNCQTYSKNLAVLTEQDFQRVFGHFSALLKKRLKLVEKDHQLQIAISQTEYNRNFV